MANTRKEDMELQAHWDAEELKEKDRIIKLQKRILWLGILAVYSGVAFIVWLAFQLKGIVG